MTNAQVNSLVLGQDMVSIDGASLTQDDIAQLERLILDYATVAMCGSVQPWGRKLRQWALDQNTTGNARLIGSGDLVNASCKHYRNRDGHHENQFTDLLPNGEPAIRRVHSEHAASCFYFCVLLFSELPVCTSTGHRPNFCRRYPGDHRRT